MSARWNDIIYHLLCAFCAPGKPYKHLLCILRVRVNHKTENNKKTCSEIWAAVIYSQLHFYGLYSVLLPETLPTQRTNYIEIVLLQNIGSNVCHELNGKAFCFDYFHRCYNVVYAWCILFESQWRLAPFPKPIHEKIVNSHANCRINRRYITYIVIWKLFVKPGQKKKIFFCTCSH